MACDNCGSTDGNIGYSGVGHKKGIVCQHCDETHTYTEWDDGV